MLDPRTTAETMRPDESEAGGLLDPADWGGLRDLGHRMVDDMLEWLRTVRERPLYEPVPESVRRSLSGPVPREPQAASAVYEDFRRDVLPYPHGNVHPRFWGWVVGTGTPLGMLADMLAAGINSNSGFGDHCAVHVERQVVAWLAEALGIDAGVSGLLVSGCSVANLTGLAIARNALTEGDVRRDGLAGQAPLVVYGSTETHSSNLRGLELLGIGRNGFRGIRVDADHRIDVEALRAAIRADREAGRRPLAVVGNAGTVNIGAFDDLGALADVCSDEGLWLHVDGAFGALAALSGRLRPLTAALERADSVAFDLHKWLHVPYDAGAILVRRAEAHRKAFELSGAYLSHLESGVATGPENFMQRGVQMSRGFRALKVWMTIKEHGIDKLGRAVEANVDQAAYLADRVEREPELELAAPVPLNIVNFRFVPQGAPRAAEELDRLNRRVLEALHASGVAAPSHTVLDGRFVLRTAISNHRSRFDDFDLLVDEVLRHGRSLAQAGSR